MCFDKYIYTCVTNSPVKIAAILPFSVTTVSLGLEDLELMSPINSVWKIIIEFQHHKGP